MRNWGRWGDDDERGALNLITADAVRRGVGCVRQGTALPLGLPLGRDLPLAGHRHPPQHFMTRTGADYATELDERYGYGFADDAVLLSCHGGTHLDALAHVWQDGRMWNGFPAGTVTSRGARRCGIDKVGPVVTRGLILDLVPDGATDLDAGHHIHAGDLDAAARRAGVAPAPGDALLVRTGWLRRWREGRATTEAWPGLDADCADWIGAAGVVVVGADNLAVEVTPSGDPACSAPLHVALLRDRGVYLLEVLDLEALAATGRPEFLFMVAPLPIEGGVGSPVAPVAVL